MLKLLLLSSLSLSIVSFSANANDAASAEKNKNEGVAKTLQNLEPTKVTPQPVEEKSLLGKAVDATNSAAEKTANAIKGAVDATKKVVVDVKDAVSKKDEKKEVKKEKKKTTKKTKYKKKSRVNKKEAKKITESLNDTKKPCDKEGQPCYKDDMKKDHMHKDHKEKKDHKHKDHKGKMDHKKKIKNYDESVKPDSYEGNAHYRLNKLKKFFKGKSIEEVYSSLNAINSNLTEKDQKNSFKEVTLITDSSDESGELIGIRNETFFVISDSSMLGKSSDSWKSLDGKKITDLAKNALAKSSNGKGSFNYSIEINGKKMNYKAIVYSGKNIIGEKNDKSSEFMFMIPVLNQK